VKQTVWFCVKIARFWDGEGLEIWPCGSTRSDKRCPLQQRDCQTAQAPGGAVFRSPWFKRPPASHTHWRVSIDFWKKLGVWRTSVLRTGYVAPTEPHRDRPRQAIQTAPSRAKYL